MKYFISYTTRDKEITKNLLETLSVKLGKLGDIFIDLVDNNSRDKQARVIFELDNSDFLILIETTSIYKSKWVIFELERAKARQIPIKRITLREINELSETEIIDKLKI
jgi:hypothetical protein